MTAGWISPRWVPLMVYVVVLAVGLYYAAMDLGGIVPVERVAGFAAVMTALLGVEAADRRWLVRPGRMVLALLSVRRRCVSACLPYRARQPRSAR